MTDRDDGRAGELLAQHPVDRRLARLVEGGGGFVEEQPVGLGEDRAGDGEPLLLTARQAPIPGIDLVEPVGERGQLRGDERVADRRVGELLAGGGVDHRARRVPSGM